MSAHKIGTAAGLVCGARDCARRRPGTAAKIDSWRDRQGSANRCHIETQSGLAALPPHSGGRIVAGPLVSEPASSTGFRTFARRIDDRRAGRPRIPGGGGAVPAIYEMGTCPPTRSCSTAGAGILFRAMTVRRNWRPDGVGDLKGHQVMAAAVVRGEG
jgi:hypothetical protein